MATPEGVLFERQVILENLLAQKKSNKRKLAAWDLQQEGLLREACFPPPPSPWRRTHTHSHMHILSFPGPFQLQPFQLQNAVNEVDQMHSVVVAHGSLTRPKFFGSSLRHACQLLLLSTHQSCQMQCMIVHKFSSNGHSD